MRPRGVNPRRGAQGGRQPDARRQRAAAGAPAAPDRAGRGVAAPAQRNGPETPPAADAKAVQHKVPIEVHFPVDELLASVLESLTPGYVPVPRNPIAHQHPILHWERLVARHTIARLVASEGRLAYNVGARRGESGWMNAPLWTPADYLSAANPPANLCRCDAWECPHARACVPVFVHSAYYYSPQQIGTILRHRTGHGYIATHRYPTLSGRFHKGEQRFDHTSPDRVRVSTRGGETFEHSDMCWLANETVIRLPDGYTLIAHFKESVGTTDIFGIAVTRDEVAIPPPPLTWAAADAPPGFGGRPCEVVLPGVGNALVRGALVWLYGTKTPVPIGLVSKLRTLIAGKERNEDNRQRLYVAARKWFHEANISPDEFPEDRRAQAITAAVHAAMLADVDEERSQLAAASWYSNRIADHARLALTWARPYSYAAPAAVAVAVAAYLAWRRRGTGTASAVAEAAVREIRARIGTEVFMDCVVAPVVEEGAKAAARAVGVPRPGAILGVAEYVARDRKPGAAYWPAAVVHALTDELSLPAAVLLHTAFNYIAAMQAYSADRPGPVTAPASLLVRLLAGAARRLWSNRARAAAALVIAAAGLAAARVTLPETGRASLFACFAEWWRTRKSPQGPTHDVVSRESSRPLGPTRLDIRVNPELEYCKDYSRRYASLEGVRPTEADVSAHASGQNQVVNALHNRVGPILPPVEEAIEADFDQWYHDNWLPETKVRVRGPMPFDAYCARFPEAKAKRLRDARDEVKRDGMPADANTRCNLFIKQEFNLNKLDFDGELESVPRAIMAADDRYQAEVGPWVCAFQHAYMRMLGKDKEAQYATNANRSARQLGDWYAHHTRRDGGWRRDVDVVEVDMETYDATIRLGSRLRFIALMEASGVPAYVCEYMRVKARRKHLTGPFGVSAEADGMMASGDPDTWVANTDNTLAATAYAVWRTGPFNLSASAFAASGDDMLAIVPSGVTADDICRTYKALGLKPVAVDRTAWRTTSPPEFCSGCFMPVDAEHYVFTPLPGRVLSKVAFIAHPEASVAKKRAMLAGNLIGLWRTCWRTPILREYIVGLLAKLKGVQPDFRDVFQRGPAEEAVPAWTDALPPHSAETMAWMEERYGWTDAELKAFAKSIRKAELGTVAVIPAMEQVVAEDV